MVDGSHNYLLGKHRLTTLRPAAARKTITGNGPGECSQNTPAAYPCIRCIRRDCDVCNHLNYLSTTMASAMLLTISVPSGSVTWCGFKEASDSVTKAIYRARCPVTWLSVQCPVTASRPVTVSLSVQCLVPLSHRLQSTGPPQSPAAVQWTHLRDR